MRIAGLVTSKIINKNQRSKKTKMTNLELSTNPKVRKALLSLKTQVLVISMSHLQLQRKLNKKMMALKLSKMKRTTIKAKVMIIVDLEMAQVGMQLESLLVLVFLLVLVSSVKQHEMKFVVVQHLSEFN